MVIFMSLISPFDPWKGKWCACPNKYTLSSYTGCGHGCLYCYASSYIPYFYQPRPKKEFLKKIKNELGKLTSNTYLTISNSSDPYQPLERKLKITQALLEILSNFNLRIMIVTKSNLVLRDLALLQKQFNLVIAITLTTLNKKLTKKLEPKAPSPQKRLKAIFELSRYLPVVCRFDPLIYPLNTDEMEELVIAIKEAGAKQIITSTFKAKADSFKRMIKVFPQCTSLWQELYLKKGEKIGWYYYLPKGLRHQLMERVKIAALKNDLEFSTCREGFPELNTTICDGSSYFKKIKHA